MTLANQTKAMTALSAAAGTNAVITKDMVNNQVLLADNLQVSEESAAKLNTAFKSQGLEAEKTTLEIVSTVEQINKATGAGLSQKEVFEDIAKLSTTVRTQFKGNFKELTLQVVKAKQLGLSLDRIVDIGRESLDVESSMTAEMEARVLTGKQLNLNEFRAAALTGDTNTMMKELVENAGTMAEYGELELYQKESLAKAFGMTTDEMSKMLEQQELLNQLNVKSLDDLTEEQIRNSSLGDTKKQELLTQIKMADTTEKMTGAAEAFKNIFAGLASIMQPVLDIVAGIFNFLSENQALVYGIGAAITTMMLPGMISFASATAAAAIQAAALAISSIATASSATLGLGALAIAAGIGVAALAMNRERKKAESVGDLFSGADGTTMVSTKEGGLFSLSDNDDVIAAPGLGNLINSSNQGTGTTAVVNNSNSEIASLLRELITKIDQPTQIHIGTRVIDELEKKTTMTRRFKTSTEQGYGLYG
jgi:hypothetical protein